MGSAKEGVNEGPPEPELKKKSRRLSWFKILALFVLAVVIGIASFCAYAYHSTLPIITETDSKKALAGFEAHLRVKPEGRARDIHYSSSQRLRDPCYYLGFKILDPRLLDDIRRELVLNDESGDILNSLMETPSWWPKSISGFESFQMNTSSNTIDDYLKFTDRMIRHRELIIDSSSYGSGYWIRLYHFPKENRAYYLQSWF